MQLKYRIFHVFIAILLGITGIVAMVMLQLLGSEPERRAVFIPKAANRVGEINVLQLAEDEVYTLLFEAKDEGFYGNLKTLTNQRLDKQRVYGSLSIDFKQPILFFSAVEHGNTYSGFLISVLEPDQFQKNIPKYLNKLQVAAVRENTALILTQMNGKLSQKELQVIADNFLKNSNKTVLKTPKKGTLLTFHDLHSKKPVSVFHEKELIGIKGEWKLDESVELLPYSLKNKGLLIAVNGIPSTLTDSLVRLIPGANTDHFPKITALVADYQGLFIGHDDNGNMVPQPKINLIVRLDSNFSVADFLQTVPEKMRGNEVLLLGDQQYQLKQLDEKTLFIGLDQGAIVNKPSNTTLMEISGPLEPILNVKGTGMFVSFLDVIPAVGAGRNYAAKVKQIHILVEQRGKNAIIKKGELRFKEGSFALHETLKLALLVNP